MKRTLALGSFLALVSIGSGLLVLVSGCAALGALDIRNPRYAMRDVRPRIGIAIPLSASTIDFDFVLEVDNPNEVALRLDDVDFDLLINDRQVLQSVSRQGVRIPARGIGNVQLTTRLGYDGIRSIWNEVVDVIQGQRARYEIRGTAYYDTPVGRLQFPLTVYSSR